MPIQYCEINGNPGYKWGTQGKCYPYKSGSEISRQNARKKALAQGKAIGDFASLDKIVSFDYDDTLSSGKYDDKVKEFIAKNYKVLILTARRDDLMGPVYKKAKELGILKENVHNTNGEDKWKYVTRLHIQTHYDNSKEQVDKINENTETKAILV